MAKYHCGAHGCSGHFSPLEKCTEEYFYCKELNCPGHLSGWEKCNKPF